MNIALRRLSSLLFPVLAICLSAPAFAQYVWIDANNVRHYSDKPPPASVPDSRILKTPRGKGAPSVTYGPILKDAPAAAKPESTSPASQAKAPQTLAEKNADFQKRRTEQAEKEKKAAEEAALAAQKAKVCESLASYKRTLESGMRVAHTEKSGERAYLDNDQRARELEEVNRNLAKCK